MLTMHENTLKYVYNSLKYKKLYNKLYLNFLLDKICSKQKFVNTLINLWLLTVSFIKYE